MSVFMDCSACTEPLPRRDGMTIGGDDICVDCLKHLFEMAIADEAEYPAHWGQSIPDHLQLRDVLGEDLYSRYVEKTIEYACPVSERVFCRRTDPPRRPEPCNHFVGQWTDQKLCMRCDKCMWYTCLRCEETFSTSSSSERQAAIDHDCDPSKERDIIDRVLQGLQRGKDYQICPNENCGRVWALWDGCNHMRCSCKAYFCFICGVQTESHYRHFERARDCPLYGQPGDEGEQVRPRPRPGNLPDEAALRELEFLLEHRARIEEQMRLLDEHARDPEPVVHPFVQHFNQGQLHWNVLRAVRQGRVRVVARDHPNVQAALDGLRVREGRRGAVFFADDRGNPFNLFRQLGLSVEDITLVETEEPVHRQQPDRPPLPQRPPPQRPQRRRPDNCTVM